MSMLDSAYYLLLTASCLISTFQLQPALPSDRSHVCVKPPVGVCLSSMTGCQRVRACVPHCESTCEQSSILLPDCPGHVLYPGECDTDMGPVHHEAQTEQT